MAYKLIVIIIKKKVNRLTATMYLYYIVYI